ncbi:replicative DNA helicase [Peribacillus castrilensis]|jgi:replicative DNA helicase|uniref:Replicative DNA helicase n=3 Tax=Peribacillus TaxID=2675229 RepID=A0A9X8ZIN6_9BACI|nr:MULTISPECIES: replicative DNA helicase [Bacillaceae]KOR81240.1 DNA helicase [Bacillus sp. FJAT-21352]KOR85077.1 DNA helicase [Bacillus sp. FJAT-22058]KRF50997.1 replicative DNA helicase [Bacillus sp. Soil745]MBD8138391.1 replicative DNA helicase [Bacillus sp. CFBP 13597]MBL3643001.1 replicative DNA helicase [Bacillus sp. RHFB]MBT2603062.1 replicative DNA helicase [Bacillus sp. ISL-53]MBT2672109.1 replicative DNA helicase [Streptomyces sp. ISL-14]MCD1160782.1 replicative DNA helicase [Per
MIEQFQDRIPPQNIEAEQAVLGAIFLEPSSLTVTSEVLIPEDFYRSSHQKIFNVMLKLNDEGKAVDLITVTEELAATKNLEEVGGVSYLSELAGSVPTAANIEYYARIVEEKSLLRRLIRTATNIAQEGYSREDEVEELLGEAEKTIMEVAQRKNSGSFQNIKDVLVATYDNIEILTTRKGDVTGIPTGFAELDRMTAGFQRNDLIIVGARPSVGKTAFALNIAQNVATKTEENVAIFSLEMGAEQLVMRMLCAEGNINAQNLRTGSLTDEDWRKLTMAMGSLSNAGIYIDDTPGVRIGEIRSKCRRLKQEHGLGMILIDYLQLIQGDGRSGDNRQQEVSEISRSLKALARELKVPVIALSQLSRGVEQRQDKRPMMSDIRESGSIEQDADIVAFLYRDDYYDKESENKNIIEIIIAKQRNGPVGTVSLAFVKEYNKFVNLERRFDDDSMSPGA